MTSIFKFDSSDETIHINLREIQAVSDLNYDEEKYGVDESDDGFKRHYFVGGGRSLGSFYIHLKGKNTPIEITHSGRRLEGKAETLAERAGENSLTAEEKKFISMHMGKVAAFMNAQPNAFVSARKFKKDYGVLLKEWNRCIDAMGDQK